MLAQSTETETLLRESTLVVGDAALFIFMEAKHQPRLKGFPAFVSLNEGFVYLSRFFLSVVKDLVLVIALAVATAYTQRDLPE